MPESVCVEDWYFADERMVLKTRKSGIFTGKTLRKWKNSRQYPTEGCFTCSQVGFQFNARAGNINIAGDSFNQHIEYSTKKRKRWMLRKHLYKDMCENPLEPEKRRVVVSEELQPSLRRCGRPACTFLYDSRSSEVRTGKRKKGRGQTLHNSGSLNTQANRVQRPPHRTRRNPNRRRFPSPPPLVDPHEDIEVKFGAPIAKDSYLLYKPCKSEFWNKDFTASRRYIRDKKRAISNSMNEEMSVWYCDGLDDIVEMKTPNDFALDNYKDNSADYEVSLMDCVSKTSPRRRRHRLQSNEMEDRSISWKDRKVFVDAPEEKTSTDINEEDVEPDRPLEAIPQLRYTVLKVASDDLQSDRLLNKYGNRYREGCSTPRRLFIDICDGDNELCPYVYMVIVVIQETGLTSTVQIVVNTADSFDLASTLDDEVVFSLEGIISIVTTELLAMRLSNFPSVTPVNSLEAFKCSPPSATPQSMLPRHLAREKVTLSGFFKHHQEWQMKPAEVVADFLVVPNTCGICFSTDSDMTALTFCMHYFCNDCWHGYLVACVRTGRIQLKCPQYECDSVVDCVTALSVLSVVLYRLHLAILDDQVLAMDTSMVRCPRVLCGRLLVQTEAVDDITYRPVQCICGASVCFGCRGESHWPSPCTIASKYKDQMHHLGDDKLIPDEKESLLTVKGKRCPTCNRFIEKNGGCNHMSCVCGREFCWHCLKSFSADHPMGMVCRLVAVDHTAPKYEEEHTFNSLPVPPPGSLRTYLYCSSLKIRLLRHPRILANLEARLNNLYNSAFVIREGKLFNSAEVVLGNEESETLVPSSCNLGTRVLDSYAELLRLIEYSLVLVSHMNKQGHRDVGRLLRNQVGPLVFISERIHYLIYNVETRGRNGVVCRKDAGNCLVKIWHLVKEARASVWAMDRNLNRLYRQ